MFKAFDNFAIPYTDDEPPPEPLDLDFVENWWKILLQASRSFLNPPGPPKNPGKPKFRDQKFEKIQKISTTIEF